MSLLARHVVGEESVAELKTQDEKQHHGKDNNCPVNFADSNQAVFWGAVHKLSGVDPARIDRAGLYVLLVYLVGHETCCAYSRIESGVIQVIS